jgi:ABC-type multidrug transport system fused ATPase/permease subunit
MAQTGHFKDTIPIISLYIFAGYRLMPALQTIYSSFSQIAFVSSSLEKLDNDIKNFLPFNKNEDQGILLFNKSISLKNICYNYPKTSRLALQNIYINIPAKSTIGLIGTTGSGKTTLVDVILGLLEPQKGSLEVDGKLITKKNLRSWQKSIGYVPQHIYLSDASIASNIAFGVDSKDFSYEAVENAAKIANLHDFVINELSNQYQTTIGERGVKLSGGQRQRIGIARALYHKPKLLIFDEATSALDNQTEHAVMEAVNNIGKNITIILIAHRLNTLKKCDLIYRFEKGQIISQASFEEVIKNH